MFETVTQASKREGLSGFVARHFGPVVDEELTREGIRDVALALIVLACLSGTLGWYVYGPGALIAAVVFGVPAVILRFAPSRVAASALLGLTATNALLLLPQVSPWLWVLFALRGVQLTFGYHRLRRGHSVSKTPPTDAVPFKPNQ